MMRLPLFAGAVWFLTRRAHAAEQAATSVSSAGSLFQVLFGLLLVLGLLAATAWLLKRLGVRQGVGHAAVKIVGGVSVGGRERVVVIEAADQWIVVGVAPGSVNALATMPKQDMPAPAPGTLPPGNFAGWLKQTIDKRNGR